MKHGLMLPNKGEPYGDANLLIELALEAETAGWEGFFLWDHIGGDKGSPTVDPWLVLAAIASRTRVLRLGTMVTPLARRRPWKVAREIVTLDHLSHGRAILGVGLGDLVTKDFKAFGEQVNPRKRAEMLDESLEIIAGLQSGGPLDFAGRHYQVTQALFLPLPVQRPRVPVWVSAHWGFKRPLRRAVRWDGVLPRQWASGPVTPAVIAELAGYAATHHTGMAPFDIIKYGTTEGKNPSADLEAVRPYEQAGATWWIEEIFTSRGSLRQMRARILAGPAR